VGLPHSARSALDDVPGDGLAAAAPNRRRPLVAEIAIAVADDHHGIGLGPALIRQMLSIAADHGIETVEARVHYDNERMMRILRRLGFHRTTWELGVATFVVGPSRA
jgi:RimJ/RimL family protein N-acetyltransferase